MRKTLCLLLCLITILGLWLPCGATAASKTGEIHKFVPKVEEYYPGFEDYIAKALRNKEKTRSPQSAASTFVLRRKISASVRLWIAFITTSAPFSF